MQTHRQSKIQDPKLIDNPVVNNLAIKKLATKKTDIDINNSRLKNRLKYNSLLTGIGLSVGLLLTSCTTLPASTSKLSTPVVDKGPVVALVLGGGGAKGFAHVGVIKALEAHSIRPNLVVGTSVGSLVGSLYASGRSANEIERLALTTKDSELTDLTLSYQGVIEGKKLRDFVNTQVNNIPIQSFPIRFGAVAAEKDTLKKAVFTEGEAGLAVQASCSVPNLFIPPRIPDPKTSGVIGKKYIDGGVISIVPVDSAKALGADIIIAVDLQIGMTPNNSSKPSSNKIPNQTAYQELMKNSAFTDLINTNIPNLILPSSVTIWSLIEQGYNTYNNAANAQNQTTKPYISNYQKINSEEINRADVIIRPDVADILPINTLDREKAIAAGVKATEQRLPEIIKAIEAAKASKLSRTPS